MSLAVVWTIGKSELSKGDHKVSVTHPEGNFTHLHSCLLKKSQNVKLFHFLIFYITCVWVLAIFVSS